LLALTRAERKKVADLMIVRSIDDRGPSRSEQTGAL